MCDNMRQCEAAVCDNMRQCEAAVCDNMRQCETAVCDNSGFTLEGIMKIYFQFDIIYFH